MKNITIINSEVAVDDKSFAPVAVLTIAIPMKPIEDIKDIEEAQQELVNGIVEALDIYRDENPPEELNKALPLSTYYKNKKEKEDVRHTDED